ncbi:TPA: hypothetical protein EYP66_01820 [Candidatus Poribacteria bacterium]|nr:hypothetical protein [Candidatus Poribacteria bacterium]
MNIQNVYHLVSDHYLINNPNIQWVRGVGEESRLYKICAESESYALKVRPVEDELSDKLEQGARAALHLQSKGFRATPIPVPCRNGSLVARHGGVIAVLYT